MRIVIDTNVVASAMFFGGHPRQLLEFLVERKLEAFASCEIIAEYQRTANELCAKYSEKPVHLPLSMILAVITVIEPTSKVQVCRDPDDDKFIECAMDAHCVYIVSGDKDLRSLQQYNGIQIVTVSEFFSLHYPNIIDKK